MPIAVAPTPKPTPAAAQVKGASAVHVAGVPAAVATSESHSLARAAVISGFGLAALFFLVVVTLPSTAARFTPPGRVLMDHQTHVVLGGLAVLLLTVLLLAVTGAP
jgi:hypothetical protein